MANHPTATASAAPTAPTPRTNRIGLTVQDYKGGKSTLCAGCGHNAISERIVEAMFRMGVAPERVAKLSGIGCSSKSPAYFMSRSHAFNTVHGRMPSVATGAVLANRTLLALGVSGDGDTGSIGIGQFLHLVWRQAAALGAARGGRRPPGGGGARRDLPVRHLQRPRRLDQVLRLREGARRSAPGDLLRAGLRGDPRPVRARDGHGGVAPRRLPPPPAKAGGGLRPDRPTRGARAARRRPRERRGAHRALLRGPDRPHLPRPDRARFAAARDPPRGDGAPAEGGAGRGDGVAALTLAPNLRPAPPLRARVGEPRAGRARREPEDARRARRLQRPVEE